MFVHIRIEKGVNLSELVDQNASSKLFSPKPLLQVLSMQHLLPSWPHSIMAGRSRLSASARSLSESAARTGRNLRTGDAITIEPVKVSKFRAGKGLKDAVE